MKTIFQTGRVSRIKRIYINGPDKTDEIEQADTTNITNLKETNLKISTDLDLLQEIMRKL